MWSSSGSMYAPWWASGVGFRELWGWGASALHPGGTTQGRPDGTTGFSEQNSHLVLYRRHEFPRETGLILRCAAKVGTPCRQSRGIDPPVSIRRGEGAQRKRCRDPRCSPRGWRLPLCPQGQCAELHTGSGHLLSCRLHLCVCPGPHTHTHTHTHTHPRGSSRISS